MAAGAHALVERNRFARPQQLLQFGFVVRHLRRGVHLEDGQRKHLRVLVLQRRIVAGDHLEELVWQPRIRVQLDVASQYEVGHGVVTGDVAANVHRIEEFLLRFVQLAGRDVRVRRRNGTIVRRREDFVGFRDLSGLSGGVTRI